MNNERRKRIEAAREKIAEAEVALEAAREIVQEVKDDEEAALDNMPESFQDGERGQAMQEAIDALDDALSEMDLYDFTTITDQFDTASTG
ncbi:hypothetical protein ABHF54_13855 (plasmid) [Nitrosomonas europaea]|uniref:hypothetical protein n=1 Tax=Nitrosomonas europaea TaxID=915 RepID=UPI0032665779